MDTTLYHTFLHRLAAPAQAPREFVEADPMLAVFQPMSVAISDRGSTSGVGMSRAAEETREVSADTCLQCGET